jgi:3-methylfumaryl-CoA hydratase
MRGTIGATVAVDVEHLKKWIGKTESALDLITPKPIAALSATLDRNDPFPQAGDTLPPLWSWLYFLSAPPMSELGYDGHAARGGFLPPVPLPRRMIAGGRLWFHRPLHVGDSIARVSRIADVSYKKGRTGPFILVQIHHEIRSNGDLALTEEQDIVYRDNPTTGESLSAPQQPPRDGTWMRQLRPDAALLFRYSALTFNTHRIHYDRPFATQAENYPGLVVHGPLIATLLLDLLRRNLPDAIVSHFFFRAVRPLFDVAPFSLFGRVEENEKVAELWAADVDGWLATGASATLA